MLIFFNNVDDKKDKPPSTFQMAQGVKEGDGFEGEAKGMLGNYWMDVKYSLQRLVRPPAQTEDHKKGNGKEATKEDSELPRKFKDRNYA